MTDDKITQTCGLVMPISAIENCDAAHWSEVKEILNTSIASAGFEANIVSNANEVGLIHKRIIQNLYDNPIVVCDVSCKNPNVMFELGLRLAFDKPTIIVKDEQTSYSFDTSIIEHLDYPRDLRFSKIQKFQTILAEKISATYEKSQEDSNYTTFLKHFGEFKVATLDETEVTMQELMYEEFGNLKSAVNEMYFQFKKQNTNSSLSTKTFPIDQDAFLKYMYENIYKSKEPRIARITIPEVQKPLASDAKPTNP